MFETVVDGSIMLDAMFAGEFTGAINYMKNIPNQPQEFYETQLFTYGYINLDNIYSDVNTIENYICVGLNTKADGSGKDYNFGAMLYLEEDIDLYFQWAKETDKEYLEYEQVENGISILGLSEEGKQAKLKTLVIPKVIEDEPVINIANESFSENEDLRLVILGNNILSIDDKAFYGTNIERVILTDSIESFSLTTFDNCDELEVIELNSIFAAVENGTSGLLAYRFAKLDVSTRRSRYILISGSSGRYGIDSTYFNDEMDNEIMVISPIAGMGLLVPLSVVTSVAQEEDVIIISPEFFSLNYCSYLNTTVPVQYVNSLIAMDANNLKKITYRYNKLIADNLFKLFIQKPLLESVIVTYMNDYGVIPGYRRNQSPTFNYSSQLVDINKGMITANGFDKIKYYSDILNNKNVKLYFSFPPSNINGLTATAKDKNYRDEFQVLLQQELDRIGVPLISNLENYLFEGQFFHDTNYHASTEGAILRTQQLIADIKAQQAKEAAESGN